MQGCVPFSWKCTGHVTYLVNKTELKCSRLQGHMEKIHMIRRMNREKEEKNSAGSKNAKLPLWSTQDEQNHDRPYQIPMSTKGTGSLWKSVEMMWLSVTGMLYRVILFWDTDSHDFFLIDK